MNPYYQLIFITCFIVLSLLENTKCQIECGKYCEQCTEDGCIQCDEDSFLDEENNKCYESCSLGLYYDFDSEQCTAVCPRNSIANEQYLTCERVGPCLQTAQLGDNLLNNTIERIYYLPKQQFIVGFYSQENILRIWNIKTKSLHFKFQVFENKIQDFMIVEQNEKVQESDQSESVSRVLIAWSQSQDFAVFELNSLSKKLLANFQNNPYKFSPQTQIYTQSLQQNVFFVTLYDDRLGYIRFLKAINNTITLNNSIKLEKQLIKMYMDIQSGQCFIILNDVIYTANVSQQQNINQSYQLCENIKEFKNIQVIKARKYQLLSHSNELYLLYFVDNLNPKALQIYGNNQCLQVIYFQENLLGLYLIDQQSSDKIFFLVISENNFYVLASTDKNETKSIEFQVQKQEKIDMPIKQIQFKYNLLLLDCNQILLMYQIDIHSDFIIKNIPARERNLQLINQVNNFDFYLLDNDKQEYLMIFYGQMLFYYYFSFELKNNQQQYYIRSSRGQVINYSQNQAFSQIKLNDIKYYKEDNFSDIITCYNSNHILVKRQFFQEQQYFHLSLQPEENCNSLYINQNQQTIIVITKSKNSPYLFFNFYEIPTYKLMKKYEMRDFKLAYNQLYFIDQYVMFYYSTDLIVYKYSSLKSNSQVSILFSQFDIIQNQLGFLIFYRKDSQSLIICSFKEVYLYLMDQNKLKFIKELTVSFDYIQSAQYDQRYDLICLSLTPDKLLSKIVILQGQDFKIVTKISYKKGYFCSQSIFYSKDFIICSYLSIYTDLDISYILLINIYTQSVIPLITMNHDDISLINLYQNPFSQYPSYYYLTYLTSKNDFTSYFTELLLQAPQSSESNQVLDYTLIYQKSVYSLDGGCKKIQTNPQDNSILVGCSDGKVWYKQAFSRVENPKITLSKFRKPLTNLFVFAEIDIIAWYNTSLVEFYIYSSLEYLGFYTIKKQDEKVIKFFQFTKFYKCAIGTNFRVIVFSFSSSGFQVEETQEYQNIRNWRAFSSFGIIVGFGLNVFQLNINDLYSFKLLYQEVESKQKYDCQDDQILNILVCAILSTSVSNEQQIRLLKYDLNTKKEIFKIQEVSLQIYQGISIDYLNGNIILYGDGINIFDANGNFLIKDYLLSKVLKVQFSLEKILFFSEISFAIFNRNDQKKITEGKYLGSYIGSTIMENKKQFCVYTTNIAYELFYVLDLNSGIKIGKSEINIEKQLIQDLRYDETSQSLILMFQNGPLYRLSVEQGFKIEQTYFHPSFQNKTLIMHQKFFLDFKYGKLIVGFNQQIVEFEYNQGFETFQEIKFNLNKDYATDFKDFTFLPSNTSPTSFFLGNDNHIWKKQNNSTLLNYIFQYSTLQIERIEVFNVGKLEKDVFILVLFAQSEVIFVDEEGRQKFVLNIEYRYSFKIQQPQQDSNAQIQNNERYYYQFILDEKNQITIIDVSSVNITINFTFQLDCKQVQNSLYEPEVSSLIFLTCDFNTIYYLDLKQKKLAPHKLILPNQLVYLKQQDQQYIYCGLKIGGIIVFYRDQSQEFQQFQIITTTSIQKNDSNLSQEYTQRLFQTPLFRVDLKAMILFMSLYDSKAIEVHKFTLKYQPNQKQVLQPFRRFLSASTYIVEIATNDKFIFVVTSCQINIHDHQDYQQLFSLNINCKYQFSYFRLLPFNILGVIYSNHTQIFQVNMYNNSLYKLLDMESNNIRILNIFFDKYEQGTFKIAQEYILYTVLDDSSNIYLKAQYVKDNLFLQETDQSEQIKKCTKIFEINDYYTYLNELNSMETDQKQNSRIIINSQQKSIAYNELLFKLNNNEATIFGNKNTTFSIETLTKQSDYTQNLLIYGVFIYIPSNLNEITLNSQIQKLVIQDLRIVGDINGNIDNEFNSMINGKIQQTQINFISIETLIVKQLILESLEIINTKYLFYFSDVSNVVIQNLIIENCVLTNIDSLFNFKDTNYIKVDNLTIISNKFFNVSNFIQFQNVQYIIMKNLLINDNYPDDLMYSFRSNPQSLNNQVPTIQQVYPLAMAFLSVENILIDNLSAKSNKQMGLINTFNQKDSYNEVSISKNDEASLSNVILEGNQIINIPSITSFIKFQTSKIQFKNSRVLSNQCDLCDGTISSYYPINFIVERCYFISNQAKNGGALYISDSNLEQGLNITSTKFNWNKAHLSGGAIFLVRSNINDLKVSKFICNTALIGGAIRQIGEYSQILFGKSEFLVNNFVQFKDNIGTSYGDNICAYPSRISTSIKLKNEYDIKLNHNETTLKDYERQKYRIRSGITLDIKVKFYDLEQKVLSLNYNKHTQQEITLLNQEFQNHILYLKPEEELSQFFRIDGGTIVSALGSYNNQTQSFDFLNLNFAGTPLKCLKMKVKQELIDKYFMQFLNQSAENEFEVCFDICKQGEIPIPVSINQIICRVCEEGTYSLYEMNQSQTADSLKKQDLKCKKCPIGSSSCQGNQIQLQNGKSFFDKSNYQQLLKQIGYWRRDNMTDNIYLCNHLYNKCIGETKEAINYCAEGYVGPLCSSCDNFGLVWNSRYILFHDKNCLKCEKNSIQILKIIFCGLCTCYIAILILKMIFQSMKKNSICQYLRLMQVLPFSRTQICERISIIKCLINFLQISVTFNLQEGFLPISLLELMRNPILFTLYQFDCFFSINNRDQIMEFRVYLLFIIPLLYLLIFLTFTNESRNSLKRKKVHPFVYQILNFTSYLFSPSIIKYLIDSIQCFEVGDQSYLKLNSQMKCFTNHQGYGLFIEIVVIPLLILLVLPPLLIFYKIKRSKSKLDYTLFKYKYGFHYVEYEMKYYWWEIIRKLHSEKDDSRAQKSYQISALKLDQNSIFKTNLQNNMTNSINLAKSTTLNELKQSASHLQVSDSSIDVQSKIALANYQSQIPNTFFPLQKKSINNTSEDHSSYLISNLSSFYTNQGQIKNGNYHHQTPNSKSHNLSTYEFHSSFLQQ